MPRIPLLFSISDVSDVLSVLPRVAGQSCWLSVPQIRRLAIAGVVRPVYQPSAHGDPALYDVPSLVLLRTWAVLGGLGIPAPARAAFLARYGDALKAAVQGGSASEVIVFDRAGGRVQAPDGPTMGKVLVRVPLVALVAHLPKLAADYRDEFEDMRAGWANEPAAEVGAELAAAMR